MKVQRRKRKYLAKLNLRSKLHYIVGLTCQTKMHTSSVMLCKNKKENESVEEDGESERVATSFNKTSAN